MNPHSVRLERSYRHFGEKQACLQMEDSSCPSSSTHDPQSQPTLFSKATADKEKKAFDLIEVTGGGTFITVQEGLGTQG